MKLFPICPGDPLCSVGPDDLGSSIYRHHSKCCPENGDDQLPFNRRDTVQWRWDNRKLNRARRDRQRQKIRAMSPTRLRRLAEQFYGHA